MLARTHGQPASPTRLGKEIRVFSERIKQQMTLLDQIPHAAKFAEQLETLMPIKWHIPKLIGKHLECNLLKILWDFIIPSHYTIEHYDHLSALCGTLQDQYHTLDLNRDFLIYISMDYFAKNQG